MIDKVDDKDNNDVDGDDSVDDENDFYNYCDNEGDDDDNNDDVDDGKLIIIIIYLTSYVGRILSIRTRRDDTI